MSFLFQLMSFNQSKKRKNNLNNFIKHVLFGKGLKQRKIIAGKARGIKMYLDPTFKFQRLIGADEREIQSLFVRFSKICTCLFDVGASDGYYSLLYKKYNPPGEVYFFDADKKYEAIQEAHFALNDMPTGHNAYTKYVSDINDEQNITLDSFEIKAQKILIKVDVEGGELTVLKGAVRLLQENDCYLIVETHSRQLEEACIDFLTSHNYSAKIIKNAWWRLLLAERRPLEHNRWLAARSQNA